MFPRQCCMIAFVCFITARSTSSSCVSILLISAYVRDVLGFVNKHRYIFFQQSKFMSKTWISPTNQSCPVPVQKTVIFVCSYYRKIRILLRKKQFVLLYEYKKRLWKQHIGQSCPGRAILRVHIRPRPRVFQICASASPIFKISRVRVPKFQIFFASA